MMFRFFDQRFHPSEGLSRCGDVLAFVAESLERPDQAELSQDAVRGLVALLHFVQSELRDIEEKVGVADPACFEERATGEEKAEAPEGE
ncbi:MAG: hypothetical protein WAW37_06905 [Syntrophobacteraceae bacterium]